MSDIISQSVAVAPHKWYIKFDHISYSRPNIEEFLSPLLALGGDRDARARKVLRRLLDQQADINEGLADENETLQKHVKGLLSLLIAKDRQLDGLIAPVGRRRGDTRNSIARLQPLLRLTHRRFFLLATICWHRWRIQGLSLSLRLSLHQTAAIRFAGVLNSLQLLWKSEVFLQFQSLKRLLGLAKAIARSWDRAGFAALKGFWLCEGVRRGERHANMRNVLIRVAGRALWHAFACVVWHRDEECRKRSGIRAIFEVYSKVVRRIFEKWSGFSQSYQCELQRNHRKQLGVKRFRSVFSVKIRTKMTKTWIIWANCGQSHMRTMRLTHGIEGVKSVFRLVLRRNVWLVLARKPSYILPKTLSKVAYCAVRTAFAHIHRLEITENHRVYTEKVSELTTNIDNLTSELRTALETCAKSEETTDILSKKLSESEFTHKSISDSLTHELESYKLSVSTLTAQLESIKSTHESNLINKSLEFQRLSEEFSALQSSHSRLESQLSQAMYEKNRMATSESEQRKHLISLTATVDSLAEERDALQHRLQAAEQSLQSTKDQLDAVKKPQMASQKREFAALEAKMKDLESTYDSKVSQKQKEIQSLQQVVQDLKSQLEQELPLYSADRDKAKRLSKENSQLSSRLEELQREQSISKSTNAQLSSQVLKLNKEIADLKIELNEVKSICSRLQSDSKTQRNELELIDTDLKRIQSERDRLILALREQKTGYNEIRGLQEQNRRLQEEVGRLQMAGKQEGEKGAMQGEIERLKTLLEETQAELEECRQEALQSREGLTALSAELDNYTSVFEVLDRRVVELENSEREAIRARDTAVQELVAIKQRLA